MDEREEPLEQDSWIDGHKLERRVTRNKNRTPRSKEGKARREKNRRARKRLAKALELEKLREGMVEHDVTHLPPARKRVYGPDLLIPVERHVVLPLKRPPEGKKTADLSIPAQEIKPREKVARGKREADYTIPAKDVTQLVSPGKGGGWAVGDRVASRKARKLERQLEGVEDPAVRARLAKLLGG